MAVATPCRNGCCPKSASLRDYRAEIIKHVIDPCTLVHIRDDPVGFTGISEAEALAVAKLQNKATIENTIAQLQP